MSDLIDYYKKNKKASAIQAKDEVRYVIDKALERSSRVTAYEHRWTKTNTDGSREEHLEQGIRFEQRKKVAVDMLKKLADELDQK